LITNSPTGVTKNASFISSSQFTGQAKRKKILLQKYNKHCSNISLLAADTSNSQAFIPPSVELSEKAFFSNSPPLKNSYRSNNRSMRKSTIFAKNSTTKLTIDSQNGEIYLPLIFPEPIKQILIKSRNRTPEKLFDNIIKIVEPRWEEEIDAANDKSRTDRAKEPKEYQMKPRSKSNLRRINNVEKEKRASNFRDYIEKQQKPRHYTGKHFDLDLGRNLNEMLKMQVRLPELPNLNKRLNIPKEIANMWNTEQRKKMH